MPERIFAIDFTHEAMTAAFVTPEGMAEEAAGFNLADFPDNEAEALDKLLSLTLAKARAPGHDIRAVALALPCDLDRGRRMVIDFPDARWLNGQPLPGLFEEALGARAVMERRAVASLCYDRAMLGLPDEGLFIGVYVDKHYNSAIWHRNGPISGRNGGAGNIAHMTIQGREDACFCGRQGCIDLYGAGVRAGQLHSMIFPDTPLEELFGRHGDHPIVLDFLSMMAYPIAMEANVLDPDVIIVGGSIPAMRGFPRGLLEEEIRRQSYYSAKERAPLFLASPASSTPGVVCAAQYARVRLGI